MVHESKLGFRADIEGLRAIAILLVVAAHIKISWLEGGFIGVDVFFVLSGYLITGLLVNEINETGSINLISFYARRFKRLLPALLFMLLGTMCLAAILLSPSEQLTQTEAAVSASLWISNFYFSIGDIDYFGPLAESNLFLHTWSLGVEEQFYLIWPALILFIAGAWRWQRRKIELQNLKHGMLAIFVVSMLLCLFLTYTKPAQAFYMMPSRAWQFALGAIVFLWTFNPSTKLSNSAPNIISKSIDQLGPSYLGWIGLSLILGSAVWLDSKTPYPGVLALLPSLGAAAVIAAGSRPSRRNIARVLTLPVFVKIGRISYSWYLWHWPLLILGSNFVAPEGALSRSPFVILAFIIAIISYHYIESPIRQSTAPKGKPSYVMAFSAALMAGSVFIVVAWQSNAVTWSNSQNQIRYQQVRADMPILYAQGWNCDEWYSSARVQACAFGNKNAKHTALIMGDSIGLQWFPAFAKIFKNPDWRMIVLTKSSCPMVDETYFYERIRRDFIECSAWRTTALNGLGSLQPDIVILGSSANYPFSKSQWIEGTSRVLDVARKVAKNVYVIRATPSLSFDGPACLSRKAWQPAFVAGIVKCESSGFNAKNNDVHSSLIEAAGRFQNVAILDLNDLVCQNGICNSERNGKIIFRDTQHLTASFVESISQEVEGRMNLATLNKIVIEPVNPVP